jgi:hypothetical protein
MAKTLVTSAVARIIYANTKIGKIGVRFASDFMKKPTATRVRYSTLLSNLSETTMPGPTKNYSTLFKVVHQQSKLLSLLPRYLDAKRTLQSV